jgi:hypothetical protein
MNIELQFAAPSRDNPKFKITLTNQYENVYRWIESGVVSEDNKNFVRDWVVIESPDRPKIKVLTGELFKGLEMAKTLIATEDNYKNAKLIKYSTSAGGVESGIRLGEKRHADENTQQGKSYTPINSSVFLKYFTSGKGYKLYILLQNGRDVLTYTLNNSSSYGFAEYHLNTGRFWTTGGYWSKQPKAALLSKDLTQEYQNEIINKFNFNIDDGVVKMNFLIDGSVEFKSCLTRAIQVNNEIDLKKLFDYLFNKHGWLVSMKGQEDYLYEQLEDSKTTDGEEKQEETVYKYHIIAPFTKDKTPPNFIEGSYLQAKESGSYGTLATKFAVTPLEASLYNLVPYGITEYEAVQNILKAVGGETEQKEFKIKVRELAANNENIKIAIFTQKAIGVLPRYAIGKVGLPESGKIIANNIDATPTEPSKAVETSEDFDEKIPLTYDTAQDFIIKLKSL